MKSKPFNYLLKNLEFLFLGPYLCFSKEMKICLFFEECFKFLSFAKFLSNKKI